jgi:hypothetical protein
MKTPVANVCFSMSHPIAKKDMSHEGYAGDYALKRRRRVVFVASTRRLLEQASEGSRRTFCRLRSVMRTQQKRRCDE